VQEPELEQLLNNQFKKLEIKDGRSYTNRCSATPKSSTESSILSKLPSTRLTSGYTLVFSSQQAGIIASDVDIISFFVVVPNRPRSH
jgi:hypothetical protein